MTILPGFDCLEHCTKLGSQEYVPGPKGLEASQIPQFKFGLSGLTLFMCPKCELAM